MKKTQFQVEDVNWHELEQFNIYIDDFINHGQLDNFLNGDITEPIPIHISGLGVEANMSATFQLVVEQGELIVEINGSSVPAVESVED